MVERTVLCAPLLAQPTLSPALGLEEEELAWDFLVQGLWEPQFLPSSNKVNHKLQNFQTVTVLGWVESGSWQNGGCTRIFPRNRPRPMPALANLLSGVILPILSLEVSTT